MSLTPTQQRAVDAGGNILLMAGAGTGKTHTLVERCLRCLLDPKEPAALDEILIVTFTDAAAAEVKQRIRKRLESELRRSTEAGADGGGGRRLQEQLALFESAPIGTLHSFCFQLIREHFYELGLDPQVAILPEEESRLMAEEALETVLNRHYQGDTAEAAAVQALIQSQGGGWDKPVRQLLMRVHHYTQTLPDPARWLVEQTQFYAAQEPGRWQEWLHETLSDWPGRWRAFLEAQGQEIAMLFLQVLETLKTPPSLEQARAACLEIHALREACPKTRLKPLKSFLDEARFLGSLLEPQTPAPLQQDWDWVRPQMAALLGLARQFEAVYSETKHELGVLDFHDLEQFALKLLWDSQTRRPTGVAEQWRKKLRYVFVDEYQDINAAQDK
ncbi:MAG TPA: UvrD-helicase domain-containing protein, partial [Clostridia bacterium]|nr:UvrD-helicase domain-containing protein [Clostridia bacterium]